MKDSNAPEEPEGRSSGFKESMGKRLQDAKDSPILKVATSKAVGRGMGLVTAVAGAVGMVEVAPLVLLATAGGLTAAAAVDSYLVYNTRQIYKEAKLLRDNKTSLDLQVEILGQHPKIFAALENNLFTPKKTGNSKTQEIEVQTKSVANFFVGVGVAVLGSVGAINSLSTSGPLKAAFTLAKTVRSMKMSGDKEYSMSEVRADLQNFIATEQKKDYSPGYDDTSSLKEQVNKQRIQTMALKVLSKMNVDNLKPEDIRNKFQEISQKIADRTNKIQENSNVFVKYTGEMFKSVVKAHDPFSNFVDPKKLQKLTQEKEIKLTPQDQKIVDEIAAVMLEKQKIGKQNAGKKVRRQKQRKGNAGLKSVQATR